ncbi:MAG TPA: enolase C-terminal domain-like protein [Microbacteriaceae bacterium]
MSTIDRITLIPVAAPFKHSFTLGSGSASGSNMTGAVLFVKLETDDGHVGWGEQRALPTWSYETIETMVAAIRHHLGPLVIGLSPFDVELFQARANRALSPSVSNGMPFARVAIDIAMHDLAGRIAGQPIHRLLGGKITDTIPLCSAIGADTPGEMAQRAEESSDYHAYKIKITGNVQLDIERIRAVSRVTAGKPLWLDANQSYSPSSMARLLNGISDLTQLVCAEQPVASTDWFGMAAIRARSSVPIAVDEGCFTSGDVAKLARFEAADLVVVKICKSGGIRNSLKTAHVAQANGIEILASGLTDCGVGFAAAVHLFSTLSLSLPAELNGPELLAELFVDGLRFDAGHIVVPDAPGLGITVNEDKLREHKLRIDA